MIFQLSRIFSSLSGNAIIPVKELPKLELQAEFIRDISRHLGLPYLENTAAKQNLCFSEDEELRPAYRNTFRKEDILKIVLPQLSGTNADSSAWIAFPDQPDSFFLPPDQNQSLIKERKKIFRQQMLEKRNQMTRKERKELSEKINKQLWELIIEKNIQVLHCYLTMGSEVDVLPLLQKALDLGIKVVVPQTLRKRQIRNLILTDLKNMEAGIFNTYHPKDAETYAGHYDLIIVAGLAFDRKGYRVGYGGGYYDTFLTDQSEALKVGLCFPFQRVESVPREAHDVQLDLVMG